MATSSDIRSVYIYMDTDYFYLSKKINIIYFTEQLKSFTYLYCDQQPNVSQQGTNSICIQCFNFHLY